MRAVAQEWARKITHPALWTKIGAAAHYCARKAAHPKLWSRVAVAAGAVVAALLFFVAGVALRLLMGPISLGPFAKAIEDSVNRSLSGLVVRFDKAELEWSSSEGKINLIIEGTRLFDLNGHIIAQAPQADLDFDQFSLLTGTPVLTRFALIGIQLTAVRTQEGVLKLGFAPEESQTDLLDAIRKTLQRNAGNKTSLDHFEIVNARLAYRDEPTGLFLVSPNANLTVAIRQGRTIAALKADVEISGSAATLAASAEFRDSGVPRSGRLEVHHLNLSSLAENSHSFAFLKPFEIDTDFSASFTLAADGSLIASDFMAEGDGMIGPPLSHSDEVRVDSARIHGRYDGPNRRVVLDQISLSGSHFRGQGQARVDLIWSDQRVTAFTVATEMRDIFLDAPGTFSPPLALDRVTADADYDRETHTVTWQRALVSGGPFTLEFTGQTQLAGENSPAIELHGSAAALSVRDLLRYWPHGVGDGARKWIDENVPQGRLGPFRIEANLPAGALDESELPDSALAIGFPIEGASARYAKGLTLLTGMRGTGLLTGDTFHVTLAQGSIGRLQVTNGEGTVSDLHIPGPPGEIKAHVVGKMSDLLALIDMKPLQYAARFHVNPAATQGDVVLDLDFHLPMLDRLDMSEVRLAAQAKVAGLVFPIDPKRQLEAGQASFTIDGKSLTAAGSASVAGVPVTFKWVEDFAPVARTTRIDIAGALDDASRARLGLSDPTWLTGPLRISGQLVGHRFAFNGATLRADLTGATLRLSNITIDKAAGVPASVTATLAFDGKGSTTVSNISLAGTSMAVSGTMTLDDKGDIVAASLPVVRAGANNDFALSVTPIPGGGSAYRVQGRSLDASRLFARSKPAAGAPTVTADEDGRAHNPFSLDAKLGQVILRDGSNLHDVDLSLAFAADQRLTAFSLDASGPAKGRVTGRFTATGGVRNVTLDAEDGSLLIRGLTGFASLRGGSAGVRVSFPADAAASGIDYRGTVTLKNVTVMNQPFLARLFAAGSLEGPLQLLQGSGIPITKFEAPFTARGRTITIVGGRASGPAVGFSFEGTVDRRHDRLDIKGSLVPLYGINSMLSDIPVLGNLLTSKPGEGIIGLTYAVRGDIDEPDISVNPLSLMTPGILRRIFEFGAPKPATQIAPPPVAPVQPVQAQQPAPTPTPN